MEEYFGTPTDPDKTVNDPTKAYGVALDTFLYAREFKLNQLGLEDEDEITQFYVETMNIWETISPHVEEFMNAEDKSNTHIQKSIDEKIGDENK